MRFHIITVFPRIFDSYVGESLFKRARERNLISIIAHDLRDYAPDARRKTAVRRIRGGYGPRRQVDDRPYGGGPGMVIQVAPVYDAVLDILKRHSAQKGNGRRAKTRIVLFSTRGKKLDSKIARRLARYDQLILICGRYEGVDERVAQYIADEEISIGDYVLSGGELPALVLMESVSRFMPGFLGKKESLEEYKGSYAVYAKPAEFVPPASRKKYFPDTPPRWNVPRVLLSGNHKKIAAHRMERVAGARANRRPDMLR